MSPDAVQDEKDYSSMYIEVLIPIRVYVSAQQINYQFDPS